MTASTARDPAVVSAAHWFWWIAGFSVVNTALHYSGSDTSFVIGLAMTALASILFAASLPLAIGLVALLVGFYVLMGFQAQQHKAWAFYTGLAVYVIDALIYVRFEDWMSVAFHAFAGYCIAKGVLRLRELARAPAVVAPVAAPGLE